MHHRIRDSIRSAPCNAGAIAIQAKVSRDELAALLRGADHCTLRTLWRVCDRLGLSVDVEAHPTPPHIPGPVETVIDQVMRKLAASAGSTPHNR